MLKTRKKKGQLWFRYNYDNGILEAHKATDGGLFLTVTESGGTPQGIYVAQEYVSNIIQWLKKAYPPKDSTGIVRLIDSTSGK